MVGMTSSSITPYGMEFPRISLTSGYSDALVLAPFGLVALSFLVTYLTMPWFIEALRRAGITGRDLHKPRMPSIPTMGGVGIYAGFAVAMTIAPTLQLDYRLLFAIFLSGTLAVLVGILDDLFSLGKLALVALTFAISLPVVSFQAGSTYVYLTPFGPADFGWFFWALVPFAFAFLMNGVNIYAGFNGLEAGLGIISSISLGICALIYGSMESAVALLAIAGGLLAFLKWNWFPAKVFVGGSGTFLLGAVLASAMIAGSIKVVGVIALFPYFINFVLRATDRFHWSVGKTLPNGKIISRKRNAFWALFMFRRGRTERYVVLRCLAVQVGVFPRELHQDIIAC
jgi:UDP-N-acetylglucosamine--dolichyl-phosphate N-acetylglucosaminephosphotransferase